MAIQSTLRIKLAKDADRRAELELAGLKRDKELAEARAKLESEELILRLKTDSFEKRIQELIQDWQPGNPESNEHHRSLDADFEHVWRLSRGSKAASIEPGAIPPQTTESSSAAFEPIGDEATAEPDEADSLNQEPESTGFGSVGIGSGLVFIASATTWLAIQGGWPPEAATGAATFVLTAGMFLFSKTARAGAEE